MSSEAIGPSGGRLSRGASILLVGAALIALACSDADSVNFSTSDRDATAAGSSKATGGRGGTASSAGTAGASNGGSSNGGTSNGGASSGGTSSGGSSNGGASNG